MKKAALAACLLAAPLLAAGASTGQPSCAGCHPKEARSHATTLMAQTLESAKIASTLAPNPKLTFKLGPYEYQIVRQGDQSIYTVTDGQTSISVPLLWALGQGEAAQTYVFELDGRMYESRVSYYTDTKALDITIGAPPGIPKNMSEAMGREMGPRDVTACFNCHSLAKPGSKIAITGLGTAAWTHERLAGVQCDHCHTGSERHAAARLRGDLKTARLARLKEITSEEMSDVCGTCHRTWADIQVNGPRGINNVRFQPYRIAKSKCYDAVDRRIGCTACHDPHNRRALTTPAAYDAACLKCHTAGGANLAKPARLCKTGKADCAGCHMPKYSLPGAHFRFTDHLIRIHKPGAPYPD